MKSYIIPIFVLVSTMILAEAQTIPTAGTGTGAFRVQISDPFGTPAFNTSTASFNTSFGWPNSDPGASPWLFNQLIQFDVTGNEAALNGADTITLELDQINDLKGVTSASLWFAAHSNVDVRAQGNGGGNGLLATAALPDSGTLIEGSITTSGTFSYDVTSVLKGLDYGANKQVYFRLEVDAPTTYPGINLLGTADLKASTLVIGTATGGGNIGSIKIVPSGSTVNLTFKLQQTTDLGTVPFTDVPAEDITVTENAFGEVDVDVNVGDPAPAKVFFRISAGQ